jgi:beta-N-acetylhexosaminidase
MFVQKDSYMRKLRFILLALTLIFAYLLEGIQSFSSSRIDVRGVITSVTRAEGEGRGKVLARVFIEGTKELDTQVDKANVTVTAETEVLINRGGERKPAEFAALKEGQRVEARFTGPVRESYPVQADAAEITILDE